MQPNNPASLIPTAHLPQVTQNVVNTASTQPNNPNIVSLIQDLQNQINKINGQVVQEELPDVILVNPSGRVVAVSGRNSAEYLSKAGFRKATPEEEAGYNKAILYQTQEYLRRMERKRIVDEKLFMDGLEKEGLIVEPESNESLLRTTITDAQKTGALEPSEVQKLNADSLIPKQTEVLTETQTTPQSSTPPSRSHKNAK